MAKNVFSNNNEKPPKIKLEDNNRINEIKLEIQPKNKQRSFVTKM